MANLGHDAVRFEPPNISPAMAAVLVGHREDARLISALILDLAARKWFEIESYSGGWALRSASHLPGVGALMPAEKILLDAAFSPSLADSDGDGLVQQYVSLTSLKHRLSGCAHAIAQAVGQDMVSAGLAMRNPVTSSALRGKPWTQTGVDVREEAQGFKKYLGTAEAGSLILSSQSWEVQRYLSFAVAFNIANKWVHSLEAVSPQHGGAGLVANPVILGAVAGVDGGFTMEALFAANVVQSYVKNSRRSR